MVGDLNTVTFTLNGKVQVVNGDEGDGMSLAKYIREVALLTGTKVSCGEGGCGACMVTVSKFEGDTPRSVNSCLSPVMICDGWSITTVEGLGGKGVGYHPIQTALAATGGTQCGYCSPGMVMQLHSYLQEHPDATVKEIDNILDGNICRCTGYRPILDAFKEFGSDAPKKFSHLIADIEDLSLKGICKRTGEACPGAGSCGSSGGSGCHGKNPKENGSSKWHQPTSVEELTAILKSFTSETKYRIVGGNTGTGVFKHDEDNYDAFVSINKVEELKAMSTDPMYLGGNVSITDAISFFTKIGETTPVWTAIGQHLHLIASVGIRNQGTLAGNLMMKNAHNDFPSDVFLSMETAGATLEIVDHNGVVEEKTVAEFVTTDMHRKFIKKIKFPSLKNKTMKKDLHRLWLTTKAKAGGAEWKMRTFKIMPRSTNAHAYVNAGFLALVDAENNFKIEGRPTLVFGGISSTFIHARETEDFLMDRNMNDHEMFIEALMILANELEPELDPVLASPLYRKQLAMGLFYKFFLYVLGDAASPIVRSGALNLDRGVSRGEQTYDTDESLWPVSEPIEKVESKWQTSGELKYVNDIPPQQGELHSAFVLSSRANCDVVSVNATKALALAGVIDFVDANDIPGKNDWKAAATPEEIFCTGKSIFAGQALGLIVAETREIAIEAARMVQVEYSNQGDVVTDIEKAMEIPTNVIPFGPAMQYGPVDENMGAASRVVQGRFKMGSQYHFHMETQTCVVSPMEDGFDVKVASQSIDMIQSVVAATLNIPINSVNTTITRLGGSYGAKIYLPNQLATAAAVAANKLGRPVRLWMPLEDNMRLFGKRTPYVFDYKMGLSSEGKIMAVEASIYCDGGWSLNDVDSPFAAFFGQSCYKVPALKFAPFGVRTDTHAPTATRAPGMCNGHAMMEAIMQHSAIEIGMSPLDLRMNNLMEQGDPIMPPPLTLDVESPIPTMIENVKTSGEYTARKEAASEFNKANRWKKRGISLVPMRYGHNISLFPGLRMNCLISVCGGDGSVSVSHNGIEMGQGINTKVAQCVAFELGIDMSMVKVKPVTNLTNPNGAITGGSAGSETNCVAAIKACEMLKERLSTTRSKLGEDATWPEIIQAANAANVDLCVHYMFEGKKDNYGGYSVWGVAITEVEVDILTGEMFIVRADLTEDAGLSTAPLVDLGQIEGAFAMGLGLWTSEEIKFNETTGEILTMNTWEYKPPAAKDIPQDFRVTMLKNARNPMGVLSSKATGEPALLLGISVLFAIWDALNEYKKDAGQSGWWQLNGPATVEHIHQHAGVNPEQFIF